MKRITVAALSAALIVALAACGDDDTTTGTDATSSPASPATAVQATETSASADHNDADVTFAQGMVPHHRQAVAMAEMVLQRGADPDVKDLAQRIKDAQAPEIETMTGWLEAWGEPLDAGMGDMGDMGDMSGMEEMGGMSEDEMMMMEETSGAELDAMFLEMMTRHHQGAIEMATTEVAEGQFPDAVALAETIIATQQAEIDEMAQLQAKLG